MHLGGVSGSPPCFFRSCIYRKREGMLKPVERQKNCGKVVVQRILPPGYEGVASEHIPGITARSIFWFHAVREFPVPIKAIADRTAPCIGRVSAYFEIMCEPSSGLNFPRVGPRSLSKRGVPWVQFLSFQADAAGKRLWAFRGEYEGDLGHRLSPHFQADISVRLKQGLNRGWGFRDYYGSGGRTKGTTATHVGARGSGWVGRELGTSRATRLTTRGNGRTETTGGAFR